MWLIGQYDNSITQNYNTDADLQVQTNFTTAYERVNILIGQCD